MKLDDFKRYQNGGTPDYPSFEEALQEIKNGRKTGHWSWYVFPTDKPSRAFGNMFKLSDPEAIAYMQDKTLHNRYLRFMREVSRQLNQGIDARTLLMSNVDVRKARDSAALFERLAPKHGELYQVSQDVRKKLDKQLPAEKPALSFLAQIQKRKTHGM